MQKQSKNLWKNKVWAGCGAHACGNHWLKFLPIRKSWLRLYFLWFNTFLAIKTFTNLKEKSLKEALARGHNSSKKIESFTNKISVCVKKYSEDGTFGSGKICLSTWKTNYSCRSSMTNPFNYSGMRKCQTANFCRFPTTNGDSLCAPKVTTKDYEQKLLYNYHVSVLKNRKTRASKILGCKRR